MTSRQQGLTLVEVLVALALFGVLMAVLLPSITALLGINRQGERQLNGTTQAQQVIESVKGAWQDTPGMTAAQLQQAQDRFDANCVPGLSLPSGVTARSQERTSRAAVITGKTLVDIVAACPTTSTTSPAMRRVQVSAGTGAQMVTLTLDVLRPQ
ncbi:type II secretion system protein [Deinococcus apachensis]|uniref:type II secretion system protein n=1 Tax=Deinococcus apachensis TaxID=309886 RepID=UPI00037F90D8|nr:type II secretion system protein [Deinococcus apachensis]